MSPYPPVQTIIKVKKYALIDLVMKARAKAIRMFVDPRHPNDEKITKNIRMLLKIANDFNAIQDVDQEFKTAVEMFRKTLMELTGEITVCA
jgi:hypothetical protein